MSKEEKYNMLVEALKLKAAEILPKGSQMSLYGSRARGDAHEVSDWDLQILIPGEERVPWSEWNVYAWSLAATGLQYDELVNPRLYSFAGWLKRSFLPFYKNVEKDKVVIFQN